MNLSEELVKENSLVQARRIATWAVEDKQHLKILMKFFFGSEQRLAHRAAWAAGKAYELKPEWFSVYIPQLIQTLDKSTHDGVRRNCLRILQTIPLPERYQGEALDMAFKVLTNPKEAIAVKAFAMTVAFQLVIPYPELAQELKIIIQDQLPYATAAIKSRALHILKKI